MLRFIKLSILAMLVLPIFCTEKRQKPFSFVQICDTQLGMGGYKEDVKRFKQAVSQINDLDADFAVICGDLVHHADDSSYADFKKIVEGFKIPCYLLPGNHDIGRIPNDTTLIYYREKIGKDYYTFRHKGYSFIVTNSQLWSSRVEYESETHDTWFKETLSDRSRKDPVIVIGHYPLYCKHPTEEDHYFNLPQDKRQELLQLFTQNKVKAYLSGHKHKVILNQYEGIQLVTGETTSKNFDKRPFGFRFWEASADTLLHTFIALESQTAM